MAMSEREKQDERCANLAGRSADRRLSRSGNLLGRSSSLVRIRQPAVRLLATVLLRVTHPYFRKDVCSLEHYSPGGF